MENSKKNFKRFTIGVVLAGILLAITLPLLRGTWGSDGATDPISSWLSLVVPMERETALNFSGAAFAIVTAAVLAYLIMGLPERVAVRPRREGR